MNWAKLTSNNKQYIDSRLHAMTSSAHVQDTWTESGRQLLLTTRLTGNRTLFSCLHSLIYRLEDLGELSKVVQTLECVSGLHNSLELSQPSSCLDEALLCKHGKKRVPNYFQFFCPKAKFRSNFDLLMQITPLKNINFVSKIVGLFICWGNGRYFTFLVGWQG